MCCFCCLSLLHVCLLACTDQLKIEIAPFLGTIATVAWPSSLVFCCFLEECCKRRARRSDDGAPFALIPATTDDDHTLDAKRNALRTALDVDDSLDNFPERRLIDKDLIDL